MGTLREGSVCSTDYTSSSEQSCDTVIYMGDNGYPVSDRDLTDCEGPPRGTAIPRPRFTPPSGLVKTSSLAKVEEVIDGRHHSTQPYSMPSPYGSLTQQSKSASGKSRLHKFVRGFTEQELLDNDLGKAKDVRSGSGRSIGGERWIDGPGSMFQNPGSRDSEQWVDGPPEFRMDTRPEESSLIRSPAKVASIEGSHSSGNKLFVSGGGISRIPHKAARTAKIAMLFKRETSPAEEETSQGKNNCRVSQSETMEAQSGLDASEIVSRDESSGQSFLTATDSCISSSDLKQSDCIRTSAGDSSMHTEDSGNTYGDTSLYSGGNTSSFCDGTKTGQDELCRGEVVALGNQVTETNIDEVVLHDQQHNLAGKGDSEENLADGYERLPCDGIDNINCNTSSLHSDELIREEDVKTSKHSDESDRPLQNLGPSANEDRDTEATERTDPLGSEDVAQIRKPSALKLDIESLFLQNRESIYELQMDQELEHGSRESLQRLMYGSDDDSSVWNSEPHSVEVVDESNPFLEALSLASFNDLLGQSSVHLLHASNHEGGSTLVQLDTERSSDADGQLDGDMQVTQSAAIAAKEAVVSDNVINVSNDVNESVRAITKAPSEGALCSTSKDCAAQSLTKSSSSASNDCLDLTTSMTSGIVPRAASTPIKPSSLRLPTSRIASSKLPEVATKSDSSKKPPPTPRTSSLANVKKTQVTNSETNSTLEQPSTLAQSARSQSKISSTAKDSSVKSGDEKESTGVKRLTTFGFKTTQPSLAKPSVPKTTSNNNSASSKKKSPVVTVASPKLPVPASPATSTKSAKQSRIALPTSSTKKSKLSPKASSDICGRAEAPSTVIEKDGRLLSPYHLVTKPRVSVHSSSGHGSDGSSVVDNRIVKSGSKTSEVEVSSGYESMIRDSEVTGTSSSQDSNSECASSGKGRGIKIFRKKG